MCIRDSYNSILPCVALLTLPFGSWLVLHNYSSLPDLVLIPVSYTHLFFDRTLGYTTSEAGVLECVLSINKELKMA